MKFGLQYKKNKKDLLLRLMVCLTIIIFITTPALNVFAAEGSIESIAKDELSKAKVPNAAIAIIQGEYTEYLFHSNRESGQRLDENSLFQLGSLSKAYTGLGILLLEDEGLLSMNDPVSDYLPWFTVSFEGQSVPPTDLTISNLLYQTSGFTNSERKYPSATKGMSLEDSVWAVSGEELLFYPSQQFAYSNTNYRILGLIIEVVSGKSYEAFMTEQILLPLGLENTYADLSKIQSATTVIEGSRLSFFRTWNYSVPAIQANVPAGYIYSNVKDMSRWLQIQMGQIEVSEQFQRIIEKSHQPNISSVADNHTYYAAGWYASNGIDEIYHSGGTPNYSANVTIRPDSDTAVCVLTNINLSANTNNIAENVLNLLDGKPAISYSADIWTIFDVIFSLITIVGVLGAIAYIFSVFRRIHQTRKSNGGKGRFHKTHLLAFIPAIALTAITVSVAVVIPLVFASPWTDILLWSPFSVVTGLISLILLSMSAYWNSFVATVYGKG